MGLFVCRCGQPEDTADYETIKKYDGESKLGKRHGNGAYFYPNGDLFEGEWKWGKKHGHGVYTYVDGTKKRGFFYEDKYVGENPGDLFAEPIIEEEDPAKPLTPVPQYNSTGGGPSSPTVEDLLRQKDAEINARRERNRQRREEIRRKYDLGKPNTRQERTKNSPYKRLLNSQKPLYASV